ncbi:DUF559 domain-containing protein [Corynebacterium glyciniphilum]|uniref:DUF559 domain-containing protein n=1 Tax=Corynebacterium glyciniphilum TaxID=1404244 RepID=UPI003FD32E1D
MDHSLPIHRGPEHTRRALPRNLPQRRRDLLASGSVTRWRLDRSYVTVASGLVVPRSALPEDVRPFGGFPADAVTRARAHAINNPGAVVGEWGAAALHGLWTDWPDSAPTVLLADRGSKGNSNSRTAARLPLRPVFRRLPHGLPVTHPDPRFPALQVVDPATTAAQCLWSILRARHSWSHLRLAGINDRLHRAVQFVDAFTQCTGLTHEDICVASADRVDARMIAEVLGMCDYGAQSPMETALRLIVAPLLPAGLAWESQVREDAEGRILPGGTVPDLACRELRVALYYDGGHHDSLKQRETDLQLTQAMMNDGWEVCRFTRHGIRSTRGVLRTVGEALHRARQRLAVHPTPTTPTTPTTQQPRRPV